MIRSIARKGLRMARNASAAIRAPFLGRKSTLDAAQAREILSDFWPKKPSTVICKNHIAEPACDLQIVIPAYNVQDYLDDCMRSVLNQQTKYSFRIVLVDDGSTDRTPEIADRYAADPRVQVIHQPNRGIAGARNAGLSEIAAPYVMFLDSDDMLCEGAIDALMNAAVQHDCDIVEGGGYTLTDGNKTVFYSHGADRMLPSALGTLQGMPWGKVFRARLFETLCYPAGLWYEDSLLSFCIYPDAQRVFAVHDMVSIYRSDRQGVTAQSVGKPRSAETYWITELLMDERRTLGMRNDAAFYGKILRQAALNQHRIAQLPERIQEAVFVLTCDLVQKHFAPKIIRANASGLSKALQNRDFGRFKLYC